MQAGSYRSPCLILCPIPLKGMLLINIPFIPSQLTTAFRTSGIGDHGDKGLQDFVSSHICNHICLGLQLSSREIMQNALEDIAQTEGEEEAEGEGRENPSDEEN